MKIFTVKIKIKVIEIFPFRFIDDWKYSIKLALSKHTLKVKFKKLNWSESEMWEMTRYCGSLRHAVNTLCFELTEDRRLHPLAEKLIYAGYDREWK